MKTEKVLAIPLKVRRLYPWILWQLWKNRNNLTFEGKTFLATESVEKLRENANQWFLAQEVEEENEAIVDSGRRKFIKRWRPPPEPWLKCNIDASWLKKNRT